MSKWDAERICASFDAPKHRLPPFEFADATATFSLPFRRTVRGNVDDTAIGVKPSRHHSVSARSLTQGVAIMQLSNYLFFTTTCEQALAFYTQCGLGKVVEVLRYGELDAPLGNEAMRGKIMHSRFEGPGVLFFASDNDDAEPMRGSAHIVMTDSREQTEQLFTRLSQGATVTTSLAIQPWGSYFGKLTDQFGVQWMINCAL
ncbi:VOC family protein [Paraburkholderia sp. DHOC27]|uniref:VOC family protein n=1 Tax=Paraburkholderia sp. DHOC27 TaxID=2303330 RepID=UPI00216AFE4A|nr:VOC family protein [Paraburkholderia sp. DHOC27]